MHRLHVCVCLGREAIQRKAAGVSHISNATIGTVSMHRIGGGRRQNQSAAMRARLLASPASATTIGTVCMHREKRRGVQQNC
jgi:hypothetical protein